MHQEWERERASDKSEWKGMNKKRTLMAHKNWIQTTKKSYKILLELLSKRVYVASMPICVFIFMLYVVKYRHTTRDASAYGKAIFGKIFQHQKSLIQKMWHTKLFLTHTQKNLCSFGIKALN